MRFSIEPIEKVGTFHLVRIFTILNNALNDSSQSHESLCCITIVLRNKEAEPGPNHLSGALTVAPEAPGQWSPVPSFPAGSGSVAPPDGPLASCSLSLCSSAGTHAGAQAPPGNPDNTHPH